MKIRGTWIFGLMLGWSAGLASAQLQVLPAPQPQVVFGGSSQKVETHWHNAGDSVVRAEIHTRLMQTSSATAMTLSETDWKKIEILPGQTILETTSLNFPAARGETKFLVQWLAESNRVIGTTTVWVYPTNMLAELKPLLDGQALGVLDPNDELKPLLKQNKVEFVDLEQTTPEDFHSRLAILGPLRSKAQWPEAVLKRSKTLMTNGTSVLWLQPPGSFRDKLQPSYFSVISGTNTIVVAQSSLVENLAENPLSQSRLLELCRQTLQPAAPALSDPNSQP